jgi:hypothetical protein
MLRGESSDGSGRVDRVGLEERHDRPAKSRYIHTWRQTRFTVERRRENNVSNATCFSQAPQ